MNYEVRDARNSYPANMPTPTSNLVSPQSFRSMGKNKTRTYSIREQNEGGVSR